jgi:ribosomal protein S18
MATQILQAGSLRTTKLLFAQSNASPSNDIAEVGKMKNIRIFTCTLGLALLLAVPSVSWAQTAAGTASDPNAPTDEEKQKAKEELEKKASALLEQMVNEVQMLHLPENRIRVQIVAGDLLWKRNESRARSMFSAAGDGLAEMVRSTDNNSRRSSNQLRQELVMTAALHDAPLAYQLVAATRAPVPVNEADTAGRRPNNDDNLELSLMAQVAKVDPKFAAQKAEEALAKNQFPLSLTRVLAELQSKDKEAFSKLSETVVGRLMTANMLSNSESGVLALSLLQAGPRAADKASDNTSTPAPTGNRMVGVPVLSPSAFPDLLGVVIDAALKVTPPSATNSQRQGNQRGGPGGARGRGPMVVGNVNGVDLQLSDAQIEQNNARRLLYGLQALLPQIDQYTPNRATAVRQKLTELGAGNNPRNNMAQYGSLMQTGTTESLLEAAPIAPPQVQSRIYQQAALKALDEGNADRARQIANEHLDGRTRDSVLQRVEFQQIASKIEADNMDQLRQALAQLHSDDERIDLLLQMVSAAKLKDKKLAAKFLSEAQRLTNRRATGYSQFMQQLAVANAFAEVDPVKSFEVLEPGISQLNELLSAAAVLSGFEVNVFRDGELPLEPNSQLTNMVGRYGQQIAFLASKDFERAETTANKFQLAEARLMVRLSIVRIALGGQPGTGGFGPRPFARRDQ